MADTATTTAPKRARRKPAANKGLKPMVDAALRHEDDKPSTPPTPVATASANFARPTTLAAAEKIISESENSFVPLGQALAAVRDACLFSKGKANTYESFESWCAQKIDMSRVHAYRVIGASQIALLAQPLGFRLNERQARELKGLENDPELLEDILLKAKADSENGKITARAIRAVRDQLANPDAEAPQTQEARDSENAGDPIDPDDGEDWPAVLSALKRSLAKLTKEMPAAIMADYAGTLEANSRKARQRAQAGV